jgi:hypothetical protein
MSEGLYSAESNVNIQNFKLNLPIDIPWERICVTEDMVAEQVCEERLPAKWNTSLAVFKYKPDEEFQAFPNYDIVYLKVTATITSYQPLNKEIQAKIDWDGVAESTAPGLLEQLKHQSPCNGAMLQVVVGPELGRRDIPLHKYPFFLDFEPKKRELFELSTDTKEKQSRSIDALNITKSGGSTQSLETMDIDMGGGGYGGQASVFGTGGGFTYSAPNGQWGTKRLNAEESMSSRSSETGQEKRESFSYSTQLSQMYHLLDSYHLGTNRVMFFIQPRPHTLEEPSGFVRGPRPVDGIQEFFMVVAQPKNQDDFCVSLRLDTAHLTKTPIMWYKTKSEITDIASVSAPIATSSDNTAEKKVGRMANGPWSTEYHPVWYQCYRTHKTDSVTYAPPEGFVIVDYSDLVNDSAHGSSDVIQASDNLSLVINVNAEGHICYEGDEYCFDCPDEIEQWAGSARRQVQANLISTTPTEKIGEAEVLLITTRGLCCCREHEQTNFTDERVVSTRVIPRDFTDDIPYLEATMTDTSKIAKKYQLTTEDKNNGLCKECAEKSKPFNTLNSDKKYNIRYANELSNFIKTETIKSLNDPLAKLQKYIDTDFFVKQLEYSVIQSKKGRQLLNEFVVQDIPQNAIPNLEQYFKKNVKEITRRDLLSLPGKHLSKIMGIKIDEVQKLKLVSLGVRFKEDNTTKNTQSSKND